MSMNLTKYVASSGAASRRKSAELVKSGLVLVNGVVETNPATQVGEGDTVEYAGRRLEPESVSSYRYIMLHKPRGYVCTASDFHAKKKALDLIDVPGVRLFSAGRLDKDSEGLILFSNDGKFVERLTHPSFGTVKSYHVSVERPFSNADIESFLSGIESDGELLTALRVENVGACRYCFVLGEGRNREIRRMVEARGNTVKRLKRVSVGALSLGSLACGCWRELTETEREACFKNKGNGD